MPTTTSPLTPTTHGLRVAASFNPRFERLLTGEGLQAALNRDYWNPEGNWKARARRTGSIVDLVSRSRGNRWTCGSHWRRYPSSRGGQSFQSWGNQNANAVVDYEVILTEPAPDDLREIVEWGGANLAVTFEGSMHGGVLPELVSTTRNNGRDCWLWNAGDLFLWIA